MRSFTPFLVLALAAACKTRGGETALKIVGGEPVSSRDLDFVVGIAERDATSGKYTVFCTGTVIAPTLVLTAAHCLEDLVPKNETMPDLTRYKVMVGNDVEAAEGTTFHDLASASRHESYEPTDTDSETVLKNDIGFVTLATPLPGTVTPIPIWTSGFKLGRFLQDNKADVTDVVELVGYGRTGANEVKTGVKRRVTTTIQADTALSFDQLILGNGERDACKGDSGGPVFVSSEGKRYLIATVSGATDFIKGADGEKIYIICRGKTRTMRLSAYWQWLAEKAGITIEKAP